MSQTLLGGGSPLNKFKEISERFSTNTIVVYVDAQDGDDKNDGEQDSPVKTIGGAMALQGMNSVLKIVLVGGHDYTFPAISHIAHKGFIYIDSDTATVVFDESSIGLPPYYFFELHNTFLRIGAKVRAESTTRLQAIASMYHGAQLHISGGSAQLNNVDYIVRANYGVNFLGLSYVAVSGQSSISQRIVNKVESMGDFVFSSAGLTLTHITDNTGA